MNAARTDLARPMPRPPVNVAPYVEALGAELAVLFLLESGGAEISVSAAPKGKSRLEVLVGADGARALADHPAMQMQQPVPLASHWLVLMMHWQGLSTAEIARRVRVAGSTAHRWIKIKPFKRDGSEDR